MVYAVKDGGAWVEKTPRQFRDERNASIPDAMLEAEGLHMVTVDPRPEPAGKTVERGPIVDRDGRPYQTWIERDLTPDEAEAELAAWRKTASLSRRDFCLALFGAGILPKNDAIAAAKGDWPTAFDGFLTGLSEQEQAGAQIEWASVQAIRRNHPMIDGLARLARLTPEQVDALFGWAG